MDPQDGKLVRSRDEIAFLPAALEIQETPPNPLGRTLMWCLVAIVVDTIAWASLGHVDVVAVAPGKVIPAICTGTSFEASRSNNHGIQRHPSRAGVHGEAGSRAGYVTRIE
jgi:hypothetical protein